VPWRQLAWQFANDRHNWRRPWDQKRRRFLTPTLLILQDPDLLEQVKQHILVQHENAASAWQINIRSVAASYQALMTPIFSNEPLTYSMWATKYCLPWQARQLQQKSNCHTP